MKKVLVSISLAVLLFSCQQSQMASLDGQQFIEKVKTDSSIQLVDVRTPQEYDRAHLKGAINIDVNSANWQTQLSQLDKSKPVYVYCLSGSRSQDMMKTLQAEGFKEVYNLDGGLAKIDPQSIPQDLVISEVSPTASQSQVPGLTEEQLNAYVQEHQNVVVDFYADWCGPCKMMDPHLKELAEKHKDKFTVLKVNFDQSRELAQKFKIRGIPHLLIYNKGQLVDRMEGFHPQMVEQFNTQILSAFK